MERRGSRLGSRVLTDQPLGDRHRTRTWIVVTGRFPRQLGHGERQPERLRKASELGADVPVGRVVGTDFGEQPERLGEARVDRGREQEDGHEGGGHGGRVAGIHMAPTGLCVRGLTDWLSPA
jgi:hypothetical protein